MSEGNGNNGQSVYKQIKDSLANLVRNIEEENWQAAKGDMTAFESHVEVRIASTGMNTTELHRLFKRLYDTILNPFTLGGYNGFMKREVCREKLKRIVNKLSDYGIFIGQTMNIEGLSEIQIRDRIENMDNNFDELFCAFSSGDADKHEVNTHLQQLKLLVNQLVFGDDMTLQLLRRRVTNSIEDTKSAANTVQEASGKLKYIEDFTAKSAQLRKHLNDLIKSIKSETYKKVMAEQVKEDITGEAKDITDQMLEGVMTKPVVQANIKECIRTVLQEEGLDGLISG